MKEDDYSDIIGLPHHVSEHHEQMSLYNRAAQFSPFAALTGYDDALEKSTKRLEKSTKRLESRRVLAEEQAKSVNETIHEIHAIIGTRPLVRLTYFVEVIKDDHKGYYETIRAHMRRIDEINRLCLENGLQIPASDLISAEIMENNEE